MNMLQTNIQKLNDAVRANTFEDHRDADDYERLGFDFVEFIYSLPATAHWLDSGAGEEARGGMKRLAAKTRLGRESMYKALSKNGNPQFSTLDKILRGMGLCFSVAAADKARKAA